jgi:hypothetical protein
VTVVDVAAPPGQTMSAKFNGVAMASEACSPAPGGSSAGVPYSFYLLNPPTGSHNIVLTAGTATQITWSAADYTGVGMFGGCVTGTGAPSDGTSVGCGVANAWVMSFASAYTNITPGSGLTSRVSDGSTGSQLWVVSDSGAIASPGSSTFGNTSASGRMVNDLLTVYYPVLSGTPEPLAWTNTDRNGSIVFTAPRAMTLRAITLTVEVPTAATPSLMDVYAVPFGTPCLTSGTPNGVQVHTGDLNANPTAAGAVQFAILSSSATALASGDSLCVDSQEPFP